MRVFGARFLAILIVQVALACICSQARADDGDPPTRVARLAYIEGSISFQPAGTNDWVAAGRNRPITIGDKIWADSDGRVEMQLDESVLRLSHNTGCSFLNLSDNTTQVQLTAGTLLVRVRRLAQNETYEIDTPNLAFSLLQAGLYKVAVNENGDTTAVVIRSGEGEVTGGGAAYTIHAHESYVFSGSDQLYATREDSDDEDEFDAWAVGRDRRSENPRSEQYVSNDVIGYQDLDEYGSWRQSPNYGYVWFPRVTSGWAPYRDGHWDYIEPWGYTWVDDAPWGFAPFHYGRWINSEGAWGWVPAPQRTEGVAVRPVYAPALVAWVGGGAAAEVGWFALGPREVYVPSYPVSRSYVERVNVSNTAVNATVVNNYYNTTIVNKNTTVTNVNYVNRTVPGGVVATSAQAFSTAQPVARNAVRIDPHVATSGRVDPITPTIVPVKQAVLGSAPAKAQPPPRVETRAVVAKATPPPPPPSFERRQEAIKKNGGKPLSDSQVKQMASPAERQQATIKIAPAAKRASTPPPQPPNRAAHPENESRPKNQPAPVPSSRPADRPPPPSQSKPQTNQPTPPNNVQPKPAERPAEHPPEPPPDNRKPSKNPPVPDNHPATRPVQPKDQPPTGHPTPPPASSPNLDKKHEQEQKQLHTQQEEERQRLQQQQQQERAKAATSQADQAQKRRMEQQHQQQTQQQQVKHAQEQKQLEQKQQEERKNQNKPQKPAPPSP